MTLTRNTRGVLATASALAVLAVPGVMTTATAVPMPPIGQCDPGSEWTEVEGKPSFELTHARGYVKPAGGGIEVTRTAESIQTLTASVEGSVEGTVSARAIIAKASTTYRVTLAASGTRTSSKSERVTYSLPASDEDRSYALFEGRRYWNGVWRIMKCNSRGDGAFTHKFGMWRSFQAPIEGGALCPASRYKKGSLPFKACKEASAEI